MKKLLPLLIGGPSILMGALLMKGEGLPPGIYLQNMGLFLIYFFAFSFIQKVVKKGKRFNLFKLTDLTKDRVRKWSALIVVGVVLVFLMLSFLEAGTEGVNRWLSWGPIKFHISSIVLPVAIISMGQGLDNKLQGGMALLALGIGVVLVLQPDAGQLSAYGVAIMLLFYIRLTNKYHAYGFISIMGIMCLLGWYRLDTLEPISYVEGILELSISKGLVWAILASLALLVLPIPFFMNLKNGQESTAKILGAYYTITIMVTFLGDFPVPMMGYGLSPVLGYSIGLNWLYQEKN